MSRPTLGSLTLIQTAYSGFNYPQSGQVVPVLGDGTGAGGNAVVQQSALTLRQASVSWLAPSPTEANTARGYAESMEIVSYTDHDGSSRNVRVLATSSQLRVGDWWDMTATLVESGT